MQVETIIAHLQENMVAYAVIGVCALPLIFFSRKYSVPVILYTVEVIIYWGLIHAAMGTLVRFAAWFKDQSSMKRAFDTKDFAPPSWSTPWMEPWNRDAYDPQWVFYLEVILALATLYAVWRYRPLRIQHKRDRRFDDKGKRIGKSARGQFMAGNRGRSSAAGRSRR